MRVRPFDMERWQSTWEHRVRYNLSESGVHPMAPEELLDMAGAELGALAVPRLGYSQSNGTDELRSRIAELYPGAGPDEVLVTNGGAEANFLTLWNLLEPGDTVAMEVPNYMQMWGLADAFAGNVRAFGLDEDRGWAPDLDELEAGVGTARAIVVTNPNNPTGAILSEDEMDRIARVARANEAWLVADEIYAGSELEGATTPSFWGRYERTIVTGGLSKAYGLPGLRIGWLVGPSHLVARLAAHKDYTSIAPATLSDLCARFALRPDVRARILDRTRSILNANLPILADWLAERSDVFRFLPPRAGAIAFIRYDLEIGSQDLAHRLRDERDVLIVPGAHFGIEKTIRIGYGLPADDLVEALGRVDILLDELTASSSA